MSANPYEAAQTVEAPTRKWRVNLPLLLGTADVIAILFGYWFNLHATKWLRFHEYLNIAGLIPLVMFGEMKNPKYDILNQLLYFGGGMLSWVLASWLIGIYLDGRNSQK